MSFKNSILNSLLDSVGEDEGRMIWENGIETCKNELPDQVWCMRQGAQGWCTGMTQRDGMGREVGGGLRMGNTCITHGRFKSMYDKTSKAK